MRDQNLDRMERQEEKDVETEKVKEMEKFLKTIAENLRAEGIPVNDNCKVDENSFKEIYSEEEIKNDTERINFYKSKWNLEEQKNQTTGEKLEMLTTAIFHKFLKDKFIVVRSSEIDDVDRKVDNVIIKKGTNEEEIFGLFDAVGDVTDRRYKEKVEKIMERNKNGASLKYGFSMDENGKIQPKAIDNIPLFYLALPEKQLEEGIKNFEFNSTSEYEKKLFEYFILSIETQMKGLELRRDINPKCQEKLKFLKESLEDVFKKERLQKELDSMFEDDMLEIFEIFPLIKQGEALKKNLLKEALQDRLEYYINHISSTIESASQKGFKLDTKETLQKIHENLLSVEDFNNAKKIEALAKKEGIELKLPEGNKQV
ncbi:MAG: hypothetical protein PHN27_03170 [Patescibacteria group bacterium]|nr:hypothetical protein [Patescibacteria group bacterium]